LAFISFQDFSFSFHFARVNLLVFFLHIWGVGKTFGALWLGSVVDPHHCDADPDPDSTNHPDANPDADSDFDLMRIWILIQIWIFI
jgi:hypothetical protein